MIFPTQTKVIRNNYNNYYYTVVAGNIGHLGVTATINVQKGVVGGEGVVRWGGATEHLCRRI